MFVIKASTFYSSKLLIKRTYWKTNIQKQQPSGALYERCSWNYLKIHWKATVLESKVTDMRAAILIKKSSTQVFFCKFGKILKINIEQLWWLLLKYFIYISWL